MHGIWKQHYCTSLVHRIGRVGMTVYSVLTSYLSPPLRYGGCINVLAHVITYEWTVQHGELALLLLHLTPSFFTPPVWTWT